MYQVDELDRALRSGLNYPEKMDDFYKKLLQSDVYIITKANAIPSGETILTEDMQIPVLTFKSKITGERLYPFFSCHKKMKPIMNESIYYCRESFISFLRMLNGRPCVLNPNTDCSKEFTTEELEMLAARMDDQV